MKRVLSKLDEAELHSNATERTHSMFVVAASRQRSEILVCLQEVVHVSMWQFIMVRFASSRAIDDILTSLAAASSLLTDGVPFVPKDRRRDPADETVDVLEYLEFGEEAEQEEPRKGKHGGKDTRKGRSKGRPRDIASRSRSGDRRGQRQGGPCGLRLCFSCKGKDKGCSKGKDAPLSTISPAATSLGMKTKGASAGHPFECT